MYIIPFPKMRITRFSILYLTHKLKNCINNSSYNNEIVIAVIIMILTLCTYIYIEKRQSCLKNIFSIHYFVLFINENYF